MDECPITPRQLEVVRELANGFKMQEIAARLYISSSTCEKTIMAARKRVRARTSPQLVSIIIASGFLVWNANDQMRYLTNEEMAQDNSARVNGR